MVDDLNAKLVSVIRHVFGDPTLVLTDAMTAEDIPDWDSLNHLNLVIAIQKEFQIKFALNEIASLKEPGQNLGTLKQLVARKIEKKS